MDFLSITSSYNRLTIALIDPYSPGSDPARPGSPRARPRRAFPDLAIVIQRVTLLDHDATPGDQGGAAFFCYF